ncbi:MAG: fused MFS/spermidine synthase [candidate division KSB1 bacterium]|jgi:spermidine synthase|nr:fused MFS/spermidine synthase [candidate division KSB1 bacterium]
MKNFPLYVAVAVSGASVLTIEILGTRVLGPFYGVSIFLWSALISITLAALSLGYYLGGRWADNDTKISRLSFFLAFAGLWLLIIPIFKHQILTISEIVGIRFAVLLAAFILFFPPLTFLGMISPYAVKLKTEDIGEVGRSAGNLYAVSTVASVLGALLTGFLLIPRIGVIRLTLLVSIILLGTAFFLLAHSKRPGRTFLLTILLILAAVTFVLQCPLDEAHPDEGLIFSRQSPYGQIRVLEYKNTRYLLIDGAVHSAINPVTGQTISRHVIAMDLGKYFFSGQQSMLLVGLGGGSIAKSYADESWRVDAVEIDPVVVEAAIDHFNVSMEDCNISIMDGRRFLLQNEQKYDLIIMDAFGSSSIPFHLITRESFNLIKEHLSNNGIFMMNVESVGWRSQLVKSVSATLRTAFLHVTAMPTHEPPNSLSNVIIIASNREFDIPEGWIGHPADYVDVDGYMHWVAIQKNHAWDNRFAPSTEDAIILTDDLNPVDVWSESINYENRKKLLEELGSTGALW